MRDIQLWRLLKDPRAKPVELLPELKALTDLPLGDRAPFFPRLILLTGSEDFELREIAIRCLKGVSGYPGFKVLVRALDDADSRVRKAALSSLEEACENDACQWIHALYHSRQDVRTSAIPLLESHELDLARLLLLADPAGRKEVERIILEKHGLDSECMPYILSFHKEGRLSSDAARRIIAKMDIDWIVKDQKSGVRSQKSE